MSKTDGEYELVLGNRQLLSAFFIIVILFGVFFTMGYVVGRNSAPTAAASSSPTTVATSQRPEVPTSTAAPPTESTAPPPAQETKEPPVETKRAAPPRKAIPPEKSEAARARSAQPAREQTPAADESGSIAVNPGPGNMYLQVLAVAQPQAGVVVETLKKKGFPALLAKGPNATLFRIVVGPYADAATLGKAKADLENAGFRPLVRK